MSYEKDNKINKPALRINYFKPIVLLSLIALVGFIFRFYYSPFDVPLSLDALLYFWFATDVSTLDYIPSSYSFPNNFWPLVLAGFFSIIKLASWLDYMVLQRILTIVISILTIIPLYFLFKKFVEVKYALIGVTLFLLEPRIIQNSFSGLTEPLFLFLGISTLSLFLSNRTSLVYVSFATLGFFSLTRYEGLLLLIPITIMFFVRFRKDKPIIKYAIVITIFILIVTPFVYLRVQSIGHDGLVSSLLAGTKVASEDILPNSSTNKFSIITGVQIFTKLIAWSTFPTFFIFIIPGTYLLFRNRDYNKYVIILASVSFLLPALYASSRNIEETRYFLMISTVFSLVSMFTIKKIVEKFGHKKTILTVIILFAIVSSIFFLNWKTDNEHERESVKIAEEIAKRTNVINDYHPESVYLRTVGFNDYQDFAGKRSEIHGKITILFATQFDTLKEFLEYGRSQGLEYLIVDDRENRPHFLSDIFMNEKDYPYLIKDFDSADIGLKYHVKIFKINYEALDFEN